MSLKGGQKATIAIGTIILAAGTAYLVYAHMLKKPEEPKEIPWVRIPATDYKNKVTSNKGPVPGSKALVSWTKTVETNHPKFENSSMSGVITANYSSSDKQFIGEDEETHITVGSYVYAAPAVLFARTDEEITYLDPESINFEFYEGPGYKMHVLTVIGAEEYEVDEVNYDCDISYIVEIIYDYDTWSKSGIYKTGGDFEYEGETYQHWTTVEYTVTYQ